ncbi:MAG: hypothetical protein HQK67_06390 [Desulfamplus sp.]|nr:hypothetical protein [Desulfamplus sp.]
MKKIFTMLFAVLLLNFSVSTCFSDTDPGEAIKILPESTDFVIKFSSAKDWYDYLSVTEKSFWGEPIEDLNEIKENFGFNPFDLKELQSNGFDVTKPFGFAVSDFKILDGNDNPYMNIIIYLPVNNADKAIAKIKEFIEDDNPDAKFTKNGDVWSWYLDIDSSEPEELEENSSGVEDSEEDVSEVEDSAVKNSAVKDSEVEKNQAKGKKIESEDGQNNSEDTDNQAKSSKGEPVETPPMAFYMVSKNGYLFFGTNPVTDAKQFFEKIGKDEKKLIDMPVFTKVIDKTNPSRELFLYANLGRVFNANPQAMKYFAPGLSQIAGNENNNKAENNKTDHTKSSDYPGLDYLKDYQGAGISADLKSPDLKADFVLNVLEKSELFNLFKNATPKRDLILGMKEKPLLLMGVVENFQVYWNIIQETLDKKTLDTIKKEFDRVKIDYNIDVEKDVIQNLGGNISAGMYDAMSINMTNINTLAALEFRDPEKMKTVIENIIAKLPPEQQSIINRVQINGNEVYMVPAGPVQIYAGFIKNDFVITLGKPMFEKAMIADIGSGFMTSDFKNKALQTALKQDVSIFFFDVGEALYTVKNFVPMIAYTIPESQIIMTPEFKKIMEPFDYLSAVSRIDGNAMTGEFIFKTRFDKPFFQGVKDVTDKIEALKKKMNLIKPSVVNPSNPEKNSDSNDVQSDKTTKKIRQ